MENIKNKQRAMRKNRRIDNLSYEKTLRLVIQILSNEKTLRLVIQILNYDMYSLVS